MNERRTDIQTADMLYTLLYDGTVSTEAGGEYSLPDYLPDIRKILRIRAVPRVTGKYMNGETIELEGSVQHALIYLSEEGTVHCFPFAAPFEASIPVSGLDENCIITVSLQNDSTVCRLSGPRKLNLRSKLKSSIRAITSRPTAPALTDSVSGITMEQICTDRMGHPACTVVCANTDELRYAEDIPLSAGGLITEILTCEVTPYITETRTANGQISCKGEFLLDALCKIQEETGDMVCRALTRRVPFSETLEAGGALDGAVCLPDFTMTDVHAVPSEDGRSCAVDFSAELSVLAMAESRVFCVTDAFLPNYQVQTKKEDVSVFRPLKISTGNFSVSGTMKYDPTDNIIGVGDCTASVTLDGHTVADGRLQCTGQLEVSAILETENHRYVPLSGTFPVRWETDLSDVPDTESEMGNALLCSCTCQTLRAGCRLDAAQHSAAADAEIAVICSVCLRDRVSMVTEISVASDEKKENGAAYPILMYYPQIGERIWDISKAYRVTPAALRMFNRLSDDRDTTTADDRVLFIPAST